jgi:hypothetical protein
MTKRLRDTIIAVSVFQWIALANDPPVVSISTDLATGPHFCNENNLEEAPVTFDRG